MSNLKCKICGTEFPAINERHYISRDLTKTGLGAVLGSKDEPSLFDAFDCPNCGCQTIAQQRFYRISREEGCRIRTIRMSVLIVGE